MRGLDRRIKEQMEERGYKVRSLVTHNVPGTGYLTKVGGRYPGSDGRCEDVVVYLIDGRPTNPLTAEEILTTHLAQVNKSTPRFRTGYTGPDPYDPYREVQVV